MITIFRTMLIGIFRDIHTLFWTIAFPLALLAGLGIYFDNPAYSERLLAGVLTMNVLFGATMVTAFYVMAHRDGRCHSCRRIGRPGMGAARHPGRIHRALHDHRDIDLPLGCRAGRVEAEAAHACDVWLTHVFRRGRDALDFC